ncbi:MAG: anion permease [Hadesarchaea archaeon]|nr:anion permease [Hadesarchaea archaeon]MDH5685528.1 anion permease [Hadesarchaea archaeon]
MIELIAVVALLAGFYLVVWNVGANGSANCVGAAVGGRILSYRRAIVIVILFVLLGAVLEGWKNMKTVGEGIVIGAGGVNPLSKIPQAAIAALLAAGIWVTIVTVKGLPVSTSQATVGAIVGAGLLISYTQAGIGASVQFGVLGTIVVAWVLSPFIAALLAFILFKALGPPLRKIKNIVLLNQVLTILVIVASAFVAYALGANDVGASTGAVYAFFEGGGPDFRLIGLFGGIALAVGVLTYSRKVMHTVGTGITRLDALTAFAAQLGAALTVWSFVQFGIPVSTTQAIVGAVAGAGLVKGAAAVSRRKLGHIGIAWVLTPAITCTFSFLLGWLFLLV